MVSTILKPKAQQLHLPDHLNCLQLYMFAIWNKICFPLSGLLWELATTACLWTHPSFMLIHTSALSCQQLSKYLHTFASGSHYNTFEGDWRSSFSCFLEPCRSSSFSWCLKVWHHMEKSDKQFVCSIVRNQINENLIWRCSDHLFWSNTKKCIFWTGMQIKEIK